MTYQEISAIQDRLLDILRDKGNIDYADIDGLLDITFDKDDPKFVKATDLLSLDDLETLISTGFAESNAFTNVDFDNKKYQEAANMVLDRFGKERATFELIQAMMLANGDCLILTDQDEQTHSINKYDVNVAVTQIIQESGKTESRAIDNLLNGDFLVVERVWQIAAFGEVVYG